MVVSAFLVWCCVVSGGLAVDADERPPRGDCSIYLSIYDIGVSLISDNMLQHKAEHRQTADSLGGERRQPLPGREERGIDR